ncbi:MAG: TRAM domain-containing protein, partial [Opitutales bacterium]
MPAIPKNFKPVPYAYHEEIELTIDTLTNLGVGLGRVDGWVVMVPLALPGERIRASVWRNKSNYSDADIVEILEASPARVEPLCPLFGNCGGCQYQHMNYAA